MMNTLVFFHFSERKLKTLKCILDISENVVLGTMFLWRNEFVKYRNKHGFMKDFSKLEFFDFCQLKKANNKLFSYDGTAISFGITCDDQSFVKYIRLISALPLEWINNNYPANGLNELKKCYLKLSCWYN